METDKVGRPGTRVAVAETALLKSTVYTARLCPFIGGQFCNNKRDLSPGDVCPADFPSDVARPSSYPLRPQRDGHPRRGGRPQGVDTGQLLQAGEVKQDTRGHGAKPGDTVW